MTGRLMTFDEVADYLNIPRRTLERWRHRGTGPPFIRLGKQLRCDPADLTRWLAEKKKAEQRRAAS